MVFEFPPTTLLFNDKRLRMVIGSVILLEIRRNCDDICKDADVWLPSNETFWTTIAFSIIICLSKRKTGSS